MYSKPMRLTVKQIECFVMIWNTGTPAGVYKFQRKCVCIYKFKKKYYTILYSIHWIKYTGKVLKKLLNSKPIAKLDPYWKFVINMWNLNKNTNRFEPSRT